MNAVDSSTTNHIRTDALESWTWDQNDVAGSLRLLRNSAVDCAKDIIGWYNTKKTLKQNVAKFLRTMSIILAGVAALLLLIAQNQSGSGEARGLGGSALVWSTAMLIVSGTLVALDTFFGFTTAWIRFIETANTLRCGVRKFKFDWEELVVKWGSNEPTEEQIAEAINLARNFITAIDASVTTEIEEWATQFRGSVKKQDSKFEGVLNQDQDPITQSRLPKQAELPGRNANGQIQPQPGDGGNLAPVDRNNIAPANNEVQ